MPTAAWIRGAEAVLRLGIESRRGIDGFEGYDGVLVVVETPVTWGAYKGCVRVISIGAA